MGVFIPSIPVKILRLEELHSPGINPDHHVPQFCFLFLLYYLPAALKKEGRRDGSE